MGKFILDGGPMVIGQIIFTGLIVVLLSRLIFELFSKKTSYNALQKSIGRIKINAVLVLAIGILGQLQGLYNALDAILKATDISPKVIFEGLMISFSTTLLGLWIFVITYLILIILNLSQKEL